MPFAVAAAVAGVGAAATIGGSIISGNAAKDAAQTQANAAAQAEQTQQNQFNQTEKNLLPFLQAGQGNLSQLEALLAGGPGQGILTNPMQQLGAPQQYNMPAFTAQQYQQSPGYAAQLQGGQQALQNAGANTTGAMSGNVLKALQGYGTGLANQDFQQAYQNYATNYQNQFGANNSNYWNQYNAMNQQNSNAFNWLSQLSGMGQNAAAQTGGFGANAATNIGSAQIGAGNALAAGQVGQANALTGGLNSLTTNLLSPTSGYQNSLLASLLQGGGGQAAYGAGTSGL
jgi:hypothetical protein